MGSQTVARFDNPAAERARVADARDVLCLDVLPGVRKEIYYCCQIFYNESLLMVRIMYCLMLVLLPSFPHTLQTLALILP